MLFIIQNSRSGRFRDLPARISSAREGQSLKKFVWHPKTEKSIVQFSSYLDSVRRRAPLSESTRHWRRSLLQYFLLHANGKTRVTSCLCFSPPHASHHLEPRGRGGRTRVSAHVAVLQPVVPAGRPVGALPKHAAHMAAHQRIMSCLQNLGLNRLGCKDLEFTLS